MLRAVEEGSPQTCWQALAAWDSWLAARGLSESTRRAYRSALVAMATETLIDPLAMTEASFVAYVTSIPARGSKRDQVVKAARSFYGWGIRRDVVTVNPAEELHARRPARGQAPSLTPEQLRDVLRAHGCPSGAAQREPVGMPSLGDPELDPPGPNIHVRNFHPC